MARLAVLVTLALALVAANGVAARNPAPQVKAKPNPAHLGDTVRFRAWYFADRSRSECTPRVRLLLQRPGARRWKRIATVNVPDGGNVLHDWVARGVRPGHYNIQATQRCDIGRNSGGGFMRIEGPSLVVRPDWPFAGQTVTIDGRGWASPKNCQRRVALSLRRPGAVEPIGRPRVRKRAFSVEWNAEAPGPARDWKVVGVQRCKAGRKRFAIKRRAPLKIESGPEAKEPPAY